MPRRASDLQVTKLGMTFSCCTLLCAYAALRPQRGKQAVSASSALPEGRCCGTSAVAQPAGEQAGYSAGRQAAPCSGAPSEPTTEN